MKKNVFIVGLDDFNLKKLKSLRSSSNYHFHGLLSHQRVKIVEHYSLEKLLTEAEKKLNSFSGSIDAIVGFWDFPVTDMVPILCKKYGLPAASLESVVKCEHKYWSRLEQSKVIKEYIPKYSWINPFEEDALSKIDIDFPFWVKPVRSASSYLGFLVHNAKEFKRSMEIVRKNISRFGEQFNYILEQVCMPDEVLRIDGNFCIAEDIIGGRQCTLEGYVFEGKTYIYGVVDSVRYPNQPSFFRYQYPSKLPKRIKQEMCVCAEKILSHIQFNNSPFNMEFFYNEGQDKVWLLEINPRISQSHCDLFEKVDGASHHEVMIDLALGKKPDPPFRKGPYNCAAKFMLRKTNDGVVTRIPNKKEMQHVLREIPGTLIKIYVKKGMRLSQLPNQDSYSYEYAVIFMGAKNQQELRRKYQKCIDALPFAFAL